MPYLDFVENLIVSVLNPKNRNTRQQFRNAPGSVRSRLYSYVEKPHMGIRTKATLYFPDRILVGRLLGLESIWIWIMVERGILGIITYCIFIFYFMPIGLALAGKMPVLSPAGFHSGVDRIFNTGNAPLSFLSGLHSDL